MREIKFRAWAKKILEMYGYEVNEIGNRYENPELSKEEPTC